MIIMYTPRDKDHQLSCFAESVPEDQVDWPSPCWLISGWYIHWSMHLLEQPVHISGDISASNDDRTLFCFLNTHQIICLQWKMCFIHFDKRLELTFHIRVVFYQEDPFSNKQGCDFSADPPISEFFMLSIFSLSMFDRTQKLWFPSFSSYANHIPE